MSQEDKHIIADLQVNPIQMPSDSYFEDLKKNILSEVGNNDLKMKAQPRIISMYRRWYVWGSAAAILAFALLFPWNNNTDPSINPEPVNLSSVSNEEIYQYLDENIEDLDTETIAVHLGKEAMVTPEISKPQDVASAKEGTENFTSKSPLLEHVKDEEILDYLKDESGELDEYLLIEG